jgi:hypothetical protein
VSSCLVQDIQQPPRCQHQPQLWQQRCLQSSSNTLWGTKLPLVKNHGSIWSLFIWCEVRTR